MTPEIVSAFRKSSYSNQQGDCVEVAAVADGGRAVRDSKDIARAGFQVPGLAWGVFVDGLKGDGGSSQG